MIITEKQLQVIGKITKRDGVGVVYFPELGLFYAVSSFTPSKSVNEIEYHDLIGNEITVKVNSYDVSMSDSNVNVIQLDRENASKIKIHKDYKFIWFTG